MTICLRAWGELGTCRPLGFGGVGPIPITAVWQWCEMEGLDPDAARIVREVIQHVDREFLERQASRHRLANVTGR